MYEARKLSALAFAAVIASALTISLTPAYAQRHGGGGGGASGHSSSDTDHADSDHGKKGKGGQRGGQGMNRGGGEGQSLRDVFETMESGSSAASSEHGSSSNKGGSAATSRGNKGSSTAGKQTGKTTPKAAAEEDSDRPAWAGTSGREGKPGRGNEASGTKRGDLFGDMYVLLRDENGVPILKQLPDGTWVVQPVDASGKPLPLDDTGAVINPELAIAVSLDRMNVARSPSSVLSQQYLEAVKLINQADTVTLDAVGRLVLTTSGTAQTLDSPLVNLALYKTIMTTGTLTGITDTSKLSSISYLVDGALTAADYKAASSFLAAASDKSATLTTDKIEFVNAILGIPGTLTDSSGKTYIDYTTFSYDRYATYKDVYATVLVKQTDGSYLPTSVNIYTTVFNTNYTGTNVSAYTQATDDARAIIDYIHNYSAPVEPTTQ